MKIALNVTALTLVIFSGVAHGIWTGRWARSHAFESAVAGLGRVPGSFGDWTSTLLPLDQRSVAVAEIAGYVTRKFENRRDGIRITVLLVCGRPGPIAVHSPEWCYGGAGYIVEAPMSER